jgi:hypothetical protein
MNVSLHQVLRTVVLSDSDPARQVLFANLMKSRLSVRLVYALHERLSGTWASALLVSSYGLAPFLGIVPSRDRRARVLVVATHANARRQVARVISWIGPDECGWVRTGLGALFFPSTVAGLVALVSSRRLASAIRIVRTLDRRYGFLVSCRAAAAIAWYVRGKAILGRHRPGAVLVSGDSHPEEVGFSAAARVLSIPQVFVSHAYPTPFSPPLRFSLSILEGEAAVQARSRKGPIEGAILLAGVEGDSAPLEPHRFQRADPVIGVFLPKAVSWPTLVAIIDDCRHHFRARKIVIRWHPSMFEAPQLARVVEDLSGIVETPKSALLPDVARQCDWVVADENSNVHLPVLKLGIPTVAVRNLGLYPEDRSDLYGFAASGVLFPPVTSIRDVRPEALTAFFSESWVSRFKEYDASYLLPPRAIGREVRQAIWQLFEGVKPEPQR